jgi:molybdate transport system permease protein
LSSRGGVTHPLPAFLVIPALIGTLFFLVPLIGLVARAPWGNLATLLRSDIVVESLRLSLVSSTAASLLALLIGVPTAFVLARASFPGRSIVRGIVLLPLVLPPVVGGAALLFGLGRNGILGGPINSLTGLILPFSIWGVIVAATFVATPFLIITVEGALRSADQRYEGAAATLGASRWTTFRRITLPAIGPSLMAGLVLTWARAFGEFGATVTFAGNLQGRTQTMPLAVFVALEQNRDAAITISLIMVGVSLAVLISLKDRWWRSV